MKLDFRNTDQRSARLIVIDVKSAGQELTVQAYDLAVGQKLEEASETNDMLVIAISALKLRDVRDLGEEGNWKPSTPEVIAIASGGLRWVRAGTHEFTNLLPVQARFVTVEW